MKMKKLKLPILSKATSQPKILSMDEYYKFLQFNLRHAFDRKAYLKQKKMLVVNVPFVL